MNRQGARFVSDSTCSCSQAHYFTVLHCCTSSVVSNIDRNLDLDDTAI